MTVEHIGLNHLKESGKGGCKIDSKDGKDGGKKGQKGNKNEGKQGSRDKSPNHSASQGSIRKPHKLPITHGHRNKPKNRG